MMGGIPSGRENGNKDISERKKKQDIQLGWTLWCIMGSNGRPGRGEDGARVPGKRGALRQGLIINDGKGRVFRRSGPWSAAPRAQERWEKHGQDAL